MDSMKKIAVSAALCTIWSLAGCGTSPVAPLGSSTATGLVLADLTTQQHFRLCVVDGALTLTPTAGSTGASSGPELIDSSTGGHYALAVIAGALRLAVDTNTAPGASTIPLVDTVTTKSYGLLVVGGALTLIPA